ncbi:hypothetical protein PT974_11622 [Cladobotryum mycophilum]|uniref:F-box domain-containing protein n=1 Tax=Cladobotryum mycophilum TaxID=491253 RepID=A0ABR0S5S7_9HYPO
MSIFKLPAELMRFIALNLGPDDLFHLALCAHYFKYILQDQYICRLVLQNYEFSIEYQEACGTGDYARALRRFVKRRNAVQTANPFQVLQISNANHFIFTHGAICYTTGQDDLRVLHLQNPTLRGPVFQEIVIDIHKLLSISIFPTRELGDRQSYTFRPLHHADGILSCLFSYRDGGMLRNFLIVCSLHENLQMDSQDDFQDDLKEKPQEGSEKARVIAYRRLPSTRGLFVRNNGKYLYYGARSEPAEDGTKRWVIRGLDLEHGNWLPRRLILKDFIGAEIGSTICFEIFEDYFYGVSNREMVDPGESVENSFYYAFRFRLEDFKKTETKITQRIVMWRRQTREGPIDDRWNTLGLSRDEQSGNLFIIETRNEMLSAVSQSLRTCYRMELVFPLQPLDDQNDSDDSDDEDFWDETTHEMRSQHIMHYGDEGTSAITLALNRTPVRCYNATCQAFVDLVDDPPSSEAMTRRLRLRVRPRVSGPQSNVTESARNTDYIHNLLSRNRDHEVHFWPEPSQPRSDSLYQVLNPQDQFDEVDSVMDERFLIYSPKLFNNTNEPRPLVLVSFDPGLHFRGLPRFYESTSDGCANEFSPDSVPGSPSCETSSSSDSHTMSSRSTSEEALEDNKTFQSESSSTDWIAKKLAAYITQGRYGVPCGYDLSRESCSLLPHPISGVACHQHNTDGASRLGRLH